MDEPIVNTGAGFKPICPYCWTHDLEKAQGIAARFGWRVWEVEKPKPKRGQPKPNHGGYVTAKTPHDAKKLTGQDTLREVK